MVPVSSQGEQSQSLRPETKRLVFLGPPGSGKGTAASWIAERLLIPHVSTGEIFRREMAAGSELGKLVDRFISRGQLVPDDVVMEIVDHWLSEYGSRGFVFDGFPRNASQAHLFEKLLERRSVRLDAVIYLNASFRKVEERVLGRLVCEHCGKIFHAQNHPPKKDGICDFCGGKLIRRDDDTRATLQKRWVVFEKQVAGLVDFYRTKGVLKEVNADSRAEDMCRDIWEVMAR